MIRKRLIAPKLFYLFWFGGNSALIPFIGIYYRDSGLDLAQIGILAALTGVIQIVASPIWGILADVLRLRRVLLPLMIAGTLPPVYLISRGAPFGLLLALVACQATFSAPVVALSDSATLALLGQHRERYGAQRVWGAVGWGTTTLLFGWLVQRYGLWVIFPGYLTQAALAGLAAAALPRPTLTTVSLRAAGGQLLRDRRWGGFLICILLISIAGAVINGFISLYLQDLGASSEQIGLAHSVASVSELPVMALSPWLIRRWGSRPLLASAGLLYTLRMVLYILAPSAGWAIAAQGLHGLCFSAMWTAGVVEAQRLAPRGLETTAQSLFGTTAFGVASVLGNAAGGRVYRDLGYTTLFSAAAVAAMLGALGLLAGLGARHSPRPANGDEP